MRLRAVACAGLLIALGATVPAQAQVYAPELQITGFWPDAALTGGGGIGLGHALDDNFMGRLRLGALYAYEPFIFNLGISGQLGALADAGFGGELEVNHFAGGWLQAGLSRVRGQQWMSTLTLGLTIFGVEWQHRFAPDRNNALLFTLRLPLGIWWFLIDHYEREESAREPAPRPRPK